MASASEIAAIQASATSAEMAASTASRPAPATPMPASNGGGHGERGRPPADERTYSSASVTNSIISSYEALAVAP